MDVKIPITHGPVIDVIKNRWSARSFSDQPISGTDMDTLIEAATWAFSASNEQPWRYVIGHKGTALFDQLWGFLDPGNQIWCKNAAVLMVTAIETTLAKNGTLNTWAMHDLGAANFALTLQANSMGIFTHPMAGFDRKRAKEELALPTTVEPVAMMALGYRDAPEKLPEPFLTRELAPRKRKPIEEVIIRKEVPK
jgi:nitroreductase